MIKRKTCPLLLACNEMSLCQEDNCAWWNEADGLCAIWYLSEIPLVGFDVRNMKKE